MREKKEIYPQQFLNELGMDVVFSPNVPEGKIWLINSKVVKFDKVRFTQ